jgi:hypothetical protein
MTSLQVITPAEAIKAAFNRFSFENLSFETAWPIASALLVLGLMLLAKKWVMKQYKNLKDEVGIKDDKQSKSD